MHFDLDIDIRLPLRNNFILATQVLIKNDKTF